MLSLWNFGGDLGLDTDGQVQRKVVDSGPCDTIGDS